MTEEEFKRQFKDLVDRSMFITVLKCNECNEIVAKIDSPKTARLDTSCDMADHSTKTGHSSYTPLKHLVIYMCQADKEYSNELMKEQKELFDKLFKPPES